MAYPFDPLLQKYPSRRTPLYARGGMVNCSSLQASAAGLEMLRRGGNAIDAAVAAAATLTVTEPTSNGLGSDAFAIVWSAREGKLFGLNASGPAPMLLQLSAALAPAVSYARDGYPCPPHLAASWGAAFEHYRAKLTEPCFEAWFRTFAPDGRAPEAGEIVRLPDHADSLEAIGESGAEAFYRGALARKIDAESRKYGGYLRYDDLAAFSPQWVEPLRVNYRGYEVC